MGLWTIRLLHAKPLQRFYAGPPSHFVFTQNATDSLNLLVCGFAKKTGAPFHAVTTGLEHNSVLRPLTGLQQDGTATLSVVPFSGNTVSLAAIKKAICPETRLVVMTHGSNVLGSVQDIRPIAEYLHANDIFFIVDGAQTAGHIPVDLGDIPVGAFVFTGHKALFGIPGTGDFSFPIRMRLRSPGREVRVRIHRHLPIPPPCRSGSRQGRTTTRGLRRLCRRPVYHYGGHP